MIKFLWGLHCHISLNLKNTLIVSKTIIFCTKEKNKLHYKLYINDFKIQFESRNIKTWNMPSQNQWNVVGNAYKVLKVVLCHSKCSKIAIML